MSSNDSIPKITLTNVKDKNYKFLCSREKIYRLKHILIIGKIVILPEYINKNININKKIINGNIEPNQEIFNKIKYLKKNKVINNYNPDITYELLEKRFKLYKFFIKNKSYLEKTNKNSLIELYNNECKKLDLEPDYFFYKKDLLKHCFTNPLIDHLYSHNNKYFISNSTESNMEEGFRLSPNKQFSTYEFIFNMFSIPNDNEELPYYFKKFKKDNIGFVINNIIVLQEPFNKSNLYRLFLFMIKDGLEEIFGNERENACRIIQKNWRIWKNKKTYSKNGIKV